MMDRRQMLRGMAAGLVGGVGGIAPLRSFGENAGSFGRLPTIAQIRAADPGYWQLADLINGFRDQVGLPQVPLSRRLTVIAALHARDLAHRSPHADGASLHSWSYDPRWTGGFYKPDDESTWPIMWDKPKEVTGYAGYGFEIAASRVPNPQYALEAWQKSPLHLNVMVNRDIWADECWQWKAIGAAFYQGFACAWFGDKPDE